MYNITKPRVYDKDWLLFDHTSIIDIGRSDCNDTITGVCSNPNSVEECVDQCKASSLCSVGYFVETPNKNYCVPLRTNLAKQTLLYNRMRNQNIYPEMKGNKSTVFVKENAPFPPDRASTIFYKDTFYLYNTQLKKYLSMTEQMNSMESYDAILSDKPMLMRFLPFAVIFNNNEEQYIPVEFNSKIILNIPQTAINLSLNNDINSLDWMKGNINQLNAFDTFILRPFDDAPQKDAIDNRMTYSDIFYIKTNNGSIVGMKDLESDVGVFYTPNKKEVNCFWKIIPKDVYGYYMDNGECKKVALEDCKLHGMQARYKGKYVSRQPNCWKLVEHADTTFNSSDHSYRWAFTIFMMIIILSLLFIN